jgi:hypothetical protein
MGLQTVVVCFRSLPKYCLTNQNQRRMDYDGESTQSAKLGFGELNQKFWPDCNGATHGRYLPQDVISGTEFGSAGFCNRKGAVSTGCALSVYTEPTYTYGQTERVGKKGQGGTRLLEAPLRGAVAVVSASSVTRVTSAPFVIKMRIPCCASDMIACPTTTTRWSPWGRPAIVDTKPIMLPTEVDSTGTRRLPEKDTELYPR